MRKNFTQKFLTIFVFLSVCAFGFKAYAQPPAADCSIDFGGEIVASDTVLCPGGNPTIIFGDGTSSSDPGFGNGGGPQVTYRWHFRTTPNGPFVPVNSSVIQSGSAAGDPEFNGRGANFNPGSLPAGLYDFVRYRYSGSELSPEACFKASNVVTIRTLDRERPTILVCATSFVLENQAGNCFRSVTLPARSAYTATDNCTGNSARVGDTLRLTYFLTNGLQIANNAGRTFDFPIGETQVRARFTDSSGNFEDCPFFVYIKDTSKPRFTGPTDFVRFTEPGFCSANITVSEFRPTFDNCTGQPTNQGAPNQPFTPGDGRVITASRIVTLTYTITDSIGNVISQSPLSGVNFIPDTRLRKGSYIIRYDATDSAGNTQFNLLRVRVIDNIAPVIVKDNSNANQSIGDRTYTTNACSRTAVDILSITGVPGTNGSGGFLDTIPTIMENCAPVRRVFITGPNDFRREFNTFNNVNGDGIDNYDNRVFFIGRSTLQYVAEDSSGNRSVMVTQFVTLVDTVKPNVFCPANETRNSGDLTNLRSTCLFEIPGLTATYNDPNLCSTSTTATSGPNGPQGPSGIKSVRYMYFMNGNMYSDTTIRIAGGNSGSFTITKPFMIGVTTVKSVAFDTTGTTGGAFGANNASDTCSFIVTVLDNQAGTFTTQSATITLNAAGSATLTPAQVVASSFDCLPRANGQGFTLSQTSFSCSDIGTRTVSITFTDSAGNVSAPQTATVTVRSNISATATTTGAFCQGGTLTVSAPTGGTGPYSYNIIAGPSDSTDGDVDGSYVNLQPGTYTVRVSDQGATNCFTDVIATVGSTQKPTTDISISATAPENLFLAQGDTKAVSVTVREVGGFAANSVSFRVSKAQLGNYTLTLGTGGANANWVRTENASFVTFTKTGSFGCGLVETLNLNLTRNDNTQRQFTLSFQAIAPPEQAEQLRFNDSFSVLFVAQ